MRIEARRASFLLLFSLLFVSCRTTSLKDGAPFQPILGATPEEAWRALLGQRMSFSGARAFAKVVAKTPEGSRSFRITIEFEAEGAFTIQVLSPAGTTLRTVTARGREVTVQEGRRRIPESIAELGRMLGIPTEGWTAADVSMLLLGLPPVAEVREVTTDRFQSQNGRFEYQITDRGLQRVSAADVEVLYDPAAFPPRRVVFRTAAGHGFELEYLELLQL